MQAELKIECKAQNVVDCLCACVRFSSAADLSGIVIGFDFVIGHVDGVGVDPTGAW